MALKQVVDTTKNTYLTKRFEDDKGNQYGDVAAKSLVAWYRFTPSAPTNLSTNKFYDDGTPPALISVPAAYGAGGAAPVLTNTDIGEVSYSTATFAPGDIITASTSLKWDHIIGGESSSTKKMTFSAWLYQTDSTNNPSNRILDFGDDRNNIIFYTQVSGPGTQNTGPASLRFYLGQGSGHDADGSWSGFTAGQYVYWRSGYVFPFNKLTHVAVTYDATNPANDPVLYIDGVVQDIVLVRSGPSATRSTWGTWKGIEDDQAVGIGNRASNDRPFRGNISEVCIWNQILKQEEIQAIYNVTQSRFTRNQAISGFLNHSPRIQSIENINYHDVHGKFDDTRTIDFIDPRQTAVLKIKKRPYDAKVITITDPHNDTGDTSGAHSASATITYTGQPSDTNVITLVSTDGTTKTYEFEGGGGVTAGNISVAISGDDADATYAALKTAVEGSSGHNGKILVTHTDDNNNAGTITLKQLLGGLPGNSTITATVAQATVPAKFTGASSPTTGATSSASKTFEFQLGVLKGAANIEINIKDAKTPAQVARKIVSAINSNTKSGVWSFTAQQTKPNEVTITRGKINASGACTITTNAGERFIEVVKQFKANPQPTVVYPSLEVADSVHLLGRKNHGGSIRSDIEIVRPVSRTTPVRPKTVHTVSPFNEAHAHSAFGFEEGIESVSPEKDMGSDFYVSGSASAIAPESIRNRKKIVLDMPVSQNTDLQLVTNADRSETNSNFPMAYYNFTDKTWQKIGLGSGSFAATPAGTTSARQTQFNQALDFTMVGFTPSKGLKAWRVADRSGGTPNEAVGFERFGVFEFSPKSALSFRNGATQHPRVIGAGSLASPTNVFGFPSHPKFHATGSQELSMSTHITKPFVLEKIVYEFNVGMKAASEMSTLSSDTSADSVAVDFDTVTFFILNQREAAVGKELADVPKIRVADSNNIKGKRSEVVTYTNPICPSGKEIPRVLQLSLKPDTYTGKVIPATSIKTGKKYKIVSTGTTNFTTLSAADSNVGTVFTANATAPSGNGTAIEQDGKDTEVSTIRDLVTWSRLTSSPSGFNSVLLDAFAKDIRKDSDLVLTPEDNTYPFGASRKISYTAQPADGVTVKLVSSDGTTKTYEFESGGGVTAGNVSVAIETGAGSNADGTYNNLKTAVLGGSGHNGKILVTHTDNSNDAGDIIFHMGPKKYSIAAECIAPVVQITSGSIDVGAAALGEIASTVSYFGVTDSASGGNPPVNVIDATTQTGQTIALSKVAIGRTLAGLQSGRSLVGENPSSSHIYTFRGLKNGDAKITAYEKDFGKSPYVILPTDKLVIGCQAPIAAALDGAHPAIRLGSGDGRVILYGYELEKEHPSYKDFSKDATGNSSFLSENIGSIAVRDEFETHPRMTYYRSSIDEVVTGSMLHKTVGTDFGTQQQIDARQVVGRNSQGTQGEVGSLLRARKLQDRSERYYDSMVPDLRNLMQADSVNTVDLTGNSNSGIILGVAGSDASYKSLSATGVQSGTKVIWDNWFSSFPFEPRYNAVSTARLPSIRKSIPSKTQTGATKSDQIKTTVDHVALALFENTGTLGVVGTVEGTYSSTGILDNPNINENTNRLVPAGRSSSLFVNTPTLTNTEVFVSWSAQNVSAKGSIEILAALDTEAEARSLNMKTLSISALADGSTTPIEEKFVFSFQDKPTDEDYSAGQTKVSVTPPVLKVTYSDAVQVSDFHDMLIQIPTTGSMSSSSGIKLFLDSAGTDTTGNATTSGLLHNDSRVNKGFVSAIGASGINLNDMWVTGSVVQIDRVQASNGVNIVDASGTTITAGGVTVNTPLTMFNDSGGNEAQRFVQLDRLVNAYDKDDIDRKSIAAGGGFSVATSPDSLMELKFKHIKAVNTEVHPTLNEPPDSNEDIVVELSYGTAATSVITVADGDNTATLPAEKQSITIESTNGNIIKYVLTNTASGGAATGTKLAANTDTGTGAAGTSNVGAIAVGLNLSSANQHDFLEQLKAAIDSANGHNAGSAGSVITATLSSGSAADGAQTLTLTQVKKGLSGNTTISEDLNAVTATNFTGGSCLDVDNSTIIPRNATWGKTIDHSTMSRSDGFIENNFKLGQSLKYKIGTIGSTGFGQNHTHRVEQIIGVPNTITEYDSTSRDVIRFGLTYTDQSGSTSNIYYQFFPVPADGYTFDNFTYSTGNNTDNGRTITAAAANLLQEDAPDGGTADYTYFYRVEKTLTDGGGAINLAADLQLVNARLLAQAINAASELQLEGAGHIKGSFAAIASQDATSTYINIYTTSFAQASAALSPPIFCDVDGSRQGGSAITTGGGGTFVGAGAADDVFVSIRQTSASVTDAYGFTDIQLKADLDPQGEFLTYLGSAETSNKKASVVSVDISVATTVDEVYAEIANAINITTSQNDTAIRPMENVLVANHVSGSNTLSLTYNIPVRENDYSPFINKVLLPLPGARYDVTGLKPSASDLNHRVIPVSDWTTGGSGANSAANIASLINAAVASTTTANTADGRSWSPGPSLSSRTLSFTQPGKGTPGNVPITTTIDTSLATVLGFIDGETAVYGDGDQDTEPLDVNANSFSKLEITCTAADIDNAKTIAFTIGGLAYSASLNTGVAVGSSTQTVIGVNAVGSNNSLVADALINSLTHTSSAFKSEITRGNITVAEKDGDTHIVVVSAKNSFHIGGASPAPTGTAVGSSEAFEITTAWTGADLLKISGAPLKRQSLQKGVVENDPEDVDTLKFASITASGNSARFYAPFIDAQDKKYLLGTDIDAGSDYYSKVFFGAGEGPSKSPRHTLSENSDIAVEQTASTTVFDIVSHDGNGASTSGAQSSSNFSYTGVSSKTIADGNQGNGSAFESGDVLFGFTGATTRLIDMTTEIQSGNTVHIRYAAASFDSGLSASGIGAPTLITAEGLHAENADASDDGIFVQASLDGGNSYQDVHTLFTTTIDDVAVTNSELFDPNSGGGSGPIYGSPRFEAGSTVSEGNHDNLTNVGASFYPIMKFTVTSNVKLRFIQKAWSGQSASFDHWWVRFLKLYVVTPGGDAGASSVALTGRANYDQTAIASNVEIRGAKYGLVSPIKLNTSAIFRAGSFGNVRDMLEQRAFTRTFDGVRVSESPVAVKFQERKSKRAISPEETNSANLDIFCTSSLPYFDGLTKDRTSQQPDLVDEIDVDITV